MEQSKLKGGAIIQHRIVNGKNEYEILGVVRYQDSTSKGTSYLRKGDKILEVNDTSVENLEPDVLIECLSKTTTHLVIHRPPADANYEKPIKDSGSIYEPYSKETRVFTFDLQMEKIDDGSTENINKSCKESSSTEHLHQYEKEEEDEVEDYEMANLLVLQLSETAISIIQGRGHTPGTICKVCHKKDCDLHDIVVQSSSTIHLVARGNANLELILCIEKTRDKMLVRNTSQKVLIAVEERPRLMSINSRVLRDACVTIFYYKCSDVSETPNGLPVVLKFSNTNCYLACHEEGNCIILKAEDYSASNLKHIKQSDETWRFVFYKKDGYDGTCKFESAKFPSWFIKSESENAVALRSEQTCPYPSPSFVFVVSRSPVQ
ncbi:uncharacterized protein LOC122803295 [Protopterus annectens]|uniref:uncharacterized protein LOC122803295 n=1 Tax=Protopterus annectens TaxID=7888 RepID=UPI001CFAE5DE|nr:uncharacterized protein LOC122803295 [Protopterus annectens]